MSTQTITRPGRKPDFARRLFDAFQHAQADQAPIFHTIQAAGTDAARATLTRIGAIKAAELEHAKRTARGDVLALRRLVAAVYHWHTRSKAILEAIIAGHWPRIKDLAYTQMYVQAARIMHPARKRKARPPGTGAEPRQVRATLGVINAASEAQAVEFLLALAGRFERLGLPWAKGLAKRIEGDAKAQAAPELLRGARAAIEGARVLTLPSSLRRRRKTPMMAARVKLARGLERKAA